MKKNACGSLHFQVGHAEFQAVEPPARQARSPRLPAQMLRIMRMLMFFLFAAMFSANATGTAQSITMSGRNLHLTEIFTAIKKQTGYLVVYNQNILAPSRPVSLNVQNLPLPDFLELIIKDQPLHYLVVDKTITFSRRKEMIDPSQPPIFHLQIPDFDPITGRVTDINGNPIASASIEIKGTKTGTTTDVAGKFTLNVKPGNTLIISGIGYTTKEIRITSLASIVIQLEEEASELKDLVVTGIYQRKKESFSGSSTTYTAKELKLIGDQNILQSLKTLDPSFAIIENNMFGSDPNRIPDIEIRGKSSVIGLTNEFGTNPNQPLFILDGFESTLTIISDLSMDRVESITLLKDAAATAIYGSKAANGVVVVETKRPTAGQLRVSYNLNTAFSFADLSDYNLMNSAEKLEYEKLSLMYGGLAENGDILSESGETLYNERLKEVQRGVNSYWPEMALRFAVTQRHTLFAEGGDANLRYGASLNYGNTQGVMKGSDRGATNGNLRLIYRKGAVSFTNSLSVDYITSNRESVPFSRFSRANPYHRKYNAEGGINKIMETVTYLDIATFSNRSYIIYNPLYDLNNNNVNKSTSQGFTNNFELEWRIRESLRARGRISIRKSMEKSERFSSPFNSDFAQVDFMQKGSYNEGSSDQTSYDGDVSVTYGKLIHQQHMVNVVGGMRMFEESNQQSGYQVIGFVDDEFPNPTFAFGYPDGRSSTYQQAQSRSASFYLNTGYAFNNKYLMDATVRSDGSSVYGADRQFTTIWTVGLGWNLHNEKLFYGLPWLNFLKLRGSIGNPGNQNFSNYISLRVYRYNNEIRNPFGTSVVINNFGNNGLEWQKTIDRNLGLDIEVLNKRLRINVDYFNKLTDPLLVMLSLPGSTGTTSIAQNVGSQKTTGATVIADYTIIRKQDFHWRINANMRTLRSKYLNIGNSLDKYNKDNISRNLIRYYDDASPSDLWAVRSKGIDPGTGREVFLNKNGEQTFVHNYQNETVVGNSEPKMDGVIGTSMNYKGFSMAVNLRYRIGGQVFMQALYEKVENLAPTNLTMNQDKRALYDRWKKTGDNALFKSINIYETTPISSRFVADNNMLTGESISIGYEKTDTRWLQSIGASSLTLRAYMNEIFRISSVTNERGIDYPFARSFSFSLGLRF